MTGVRTRFAPTPSGYLHEGNAANALLVSWLAAHGDGQLVLRIDDADAARSRPEYVDDVFHVLTWLGVDYAEGPQDRADFARRWSQGLRTAEYRAALDRVAPDIEVYACTCSRRDLAGPAVGGCPGGCRSAGHPLVPGQSSLRLHVPPGTVVDVDGTGVEVAAEIGDFVVWRRDDLPAYHLASVVDDDRLGITHIVRGDDLRTSTAAQRFLAAAIGAEHFQAAVVVHHALVTSADGAKLSKSQMVHGAPLPRDEATRARIHDLAQALGRPLGITPP